MKTRAFRNSLARLLACVGLFSTAAASAALPPESACSLPNTVFCSGFEEGNFSIWNDYDANSAPNNVLLSDPGPLNLSGNSVVRLRIPAGSGNSDLVKLFSSSPGRTAYVRWFQKWESGYDFNAPVHGSGLNGGGRDYIGRSGIRPNGSDWFSAWLEPWKGRMNLYVYYRGMYQDCANPNGTCYGDHFPCFHDEGENYCEKPQHRERVLPPLMQANQWYCFEMMLDSGTPVSQDSSADGALDFWIDGTQYGPWNGLWFRTSANLQLSTLFMNLYHHAEHSVGGVLIDNIVVSKERIGCSKIATTPNSPTNLVVQ